MPPDHRAEHVGRQPVTAPSTVTGVPSAPKATGAVLKISTNTTRFERREADQDQQRSGDRDRRAESGNAFEQRAEAEADDDQHHAPIVRQMVRHPCAERVEAASIDRDVVEQQSVDDDPHHRPQREDRAVEHRVDRQIDRQGPKADRDKEGDNEARERRLPGRPSHDAREPEQPRPAAPRRETTAVGCPPQASAIGETYLPLLGVRPGRRLVFPSRQTLASWPPALHCPGRLPTVISIPE